MLAKQFFFCKFASKINDTYFTIWKSSHKYSNQSVRCFGATQ